MFGKPVFRQLAPAIAITGVAIMPARADLAISNEPTQNVTCAAGNCTAIAAQAVMNVADLQTMLASGDVQLSSGTLANNIVVKAPLGWASAHTLGLSAQDSVTVEEPVTIASSGGLSVSTTDGSLAIGDKASITFADLNSSLSINGNVYLLFADLPTLADAINGDPQGFYALAKDCDDRGNTYWDSPIYNTFYGGFEGLGHTISNLTLVNRANTGDQGLFAYTFRTAKISNIRLAHATAPAPRLQTGGFLVGENWGAIDRASVTGTAPESAGNFGGLVGENEGNVSNSSARIDGRTHAAQQPGVLVGANFGVISNSYAEGKLTATPFSGRGGIAGDNSGRIEDSYAMAGIGGETAGAYYAGIIVGNSATMIAADAAGQTPLPNGDTTHVGRVAGADEHPIGRATNASWGPGVNDPAQHVGSIFTAQQLQSGLPSGFDPKIWAQDANINSGLPYLRSNPPAK